MEFYDSDPKKNNPFWDSSLTVEERLDWLLSEMTMEEKLKCLASSVPALERFGIPETGVGGEAAHGIQARNDFLGPGKADLTTSFVQPIGMSATWDPELIRRAGEVTGSEARVLSRRHQGRGLSRWAPTVDLERDPRWGRTEEGYGEDPFLTGEMASAYVLGMQGDDPRYLRVAATLKHFYANNTEAGRVWKSASVDPRNKYELYLEPFRRVIEKGKAEAVMTAYNKINGTPCILNSEVRTLLKEKYGLRHAVSDGGAMELVVTRQHYYGTHAETLAAALKAGVDAMSDNSTLVARAAQEAWELGLVTQEEIDGALRNMFRTKLRLGLFDAPGQNPFDRVTEEDLASEENRAVCRQVSREAVVLLKNDGILPLPENIRQDSLALAGPLADVWYQDWYGGEPPFKTTLREGMAEILGEAPETADGWDRIVFRVGAKGLAVGPEEELILSDAPDLFVREDWGDGVFVFRCLRTGKYLSTRLFPEDGAEEPKAEKIRADRDSVFDWFVKEIFHVLEHGDGSVSLTDRFDDPLQIRDGVLWAVSEGEPARFVVETVESGVETVRRLAEKKHTVILALGCNPMLNAKEEVDRSTIALPPAQEALLEAVADSGAQLITVLFSNYPYAVGAVQEMASAVLWSATGAQDMGSVMAETLFGKNVPAGRLNLTWYQDDSQLPDIDDYDMIKNGRTYRYFPGQALYPFGYGLTYTDFAYSDLTVAQEEKNSLRVAFSVTNAGTVASDEVAQVYGIAPPSRVNKPLRQLLGFQRLKEVRPGETRRVELTVCTEEFRFYDVISGSFMVEEGDYTVFAGPSSADRRLVKTVPISGQKPGFRRLTDRIAADRYDDYENIVLTEGHFGFCAAVVADRERDGFLFYRDCLMGENPVAVSLYLKCCQGGGVEVLIDGIHAASWQGETGSYLQVPPQEADNRGRREAVERRKTWKTVFADVRLALPGRMPGEDGGKSTAPCAFTLRLWGDVELCCFRIVTEEK